ncbi:MAG: DUF4382 domain-containing protein [Ignavibacteriales bacterium]|nr:DUF4382 domain-containing protein [Ignavibacteriales bacterium]
MDIKVERIEGRINTFPTKVHTMFAHAACSRVMASVVLVLCAAIGSLELGCNNSSDASGADYMGQLNVRLVDATAGFDQMNLVIRKIEIHRTNSGQDVGWRIVTDQLKSYDVLRLTNGRSDTIVFKDVPMGDYDQIRILFGISTLVINGAQLTIQIPIAIADGYIINYAFHVDEGLQYQLYLDIDASRSVKSVSSTTYNLTPAIRAQSALLSGSVSGAVVGVGADSLGVAASIETSTSGGTAATLSDPASGGSFQLVALPEGAYNLHIMAGDTLKYFDTTFVGINVVRQKDNGIVGVVRLRHR